MAPGMAVSNTTVAPSKCEVNLYDSMYMSTNDHIKAHVACIVCTDCPIIDLKFMDVQMQSGTCGCGLFSIAFATALVHGAHPGQFLFDQQQMRRHLWQYLERRKMVMFPVKKKSTWHSQQSEEY